jgi:hypothetical protein
MKEFQDSTDPITEIVVSRYFIIKAYALYAEKQ